MVKPAEKGKTTENAKEMKRLYEEHFWGIRRISIDRLVQAEMGPNDISARPRETAHVNQIAQEIIKNYMMFQSPLAVVVIPIDGVPGTYYKAQFTDIIFTREDVFFKVFGHQHFLAALLIARQYARDHNMFDLANHLAEVYIGVWVGLNHHNGKMLANIHNDVCHKIRQRDSWQLVLGLKINFVSQGSPIQASGRNPTDPNCLARKDYETMKA